MRGEARVIVDKGEHLVRCPRDQRGTLTMALHWQLRLRDQLLVASAGLVPRK